MIIVKTPFRISLFGGGTDFPAWYSTNGGAVLGFALNKYSWITLRRLPPFFPHRNRIVWSKIELTQGPGDVEHPAVRAVLQSRHINTGIEMHHDGDLPARSGLGSSSAFVVGLLSALDAMEYRRSTPADLAQEAIHIEQNVIGETVGCQDQIWASYGGLRRIDFDNTGFRVRSLLLSPERIAELLLHLMLFFTGMQRTASMIEARKIDRLPANANFLRAITRQVDDAEIILTDRRRRLEPIGELLDAAWTWKQRLADGVTTREIDQIYAVARSAGAIGGKLLGAGGGGFMLLFAPPARQPEIRSALRDLVEVPIGIDWHGSDVVLFQPNGFLT